MFILLFKLNHKEILDYRVVIKTTEIKGSPLENELVYDCALSLKKEKFDSDIVHIKRSGVLLNNTYDQSPANELLLVAGEAISDLDLEISPYGKILNIKDYRNVQKKWEAIKHAIRITYRGGLVEKIISPLDNALQDKESTVTSLGKDPFFYNFLAGIYGKYENGMNAYEGLLWGLSDMPLKVAKYNKLELDGMGNVNVGFSMKAHPESLKIWETSLTESRGAGVLETALGGNCQFLSRNYIRSVNSCFEAYWNQQLFKRIEININLKGN